MKLQFSKTFLLAAVVWTGLSVAPLTAQTNQTTSPVTDVATSAPSTGIADILKMLDAHVSPDVIRTYVETSSASYDLSPADLIALKQHGVTDDITVALLKHNSTSSAPAATASTTADSTQSSAPIRAYIVNTGRSDPESYAFFQHYYLMPRTQAYVDQTLGYPSVSSGDGFVPYYPPGYYGYGFAAGPGFGGNFGVVGAARNRFNRARGLQGGFIVRH